MTEAATSAISQRKIYLVQGSVRTLLRNNENKEFSSARPLFSLRVRLWERHVLTRCHGTKRTGRGRGNIDGPNVIDDLYAVAVALKRSRKYIFILPLRLVLATRSSCLPDAPCSIRYQPADWSTSCPEDQALYQCPSHSFMGSTVGGIGGSHAPQPPTEPPARARRLFKARIRQASRSRKGTILVTATR